MKINYFRFLQFFGASIISSVVFFACFTKKVSDPSFDSENSSLSMLDLMETHSIEGNFFRGKSRENDLFCAQLLNKIALPLAELRNSLPQSFVFNAKSLALKISLLQQGDCHDKNADKTIAIIQSYLRQQVDKIGFILPLQTRYTKIVSSLLEGVALRFPESQMVLRGYADSSEKGLRERYGQLVFNDEVTLLVGGVSPASASFLLVNTQKIYLPLIILNPDQSYLKDNPLALQIFPNNAEQMQGLISLSLKKGYKRIAILEPLGGKAASLVQDFVTAAKKEKISIVSHLNYTPGDYPTMDTAIRSLTALDLREREVEYKELLQKAEKEAQKRGRVFNPKSVYLPPRLGCDAVFIPDHYKMVQYFVKLFRYHGVERVPLLGTSEWRSQGLIEPWDPFLNDAFFVDHIGSYRQLPWKVTANLPFSDYLVSDEEVSAIDFKMVGYKIGQILLTVTNSHGIKRVNVVQSALNLTGQETFAPTRSLKWPTYLFEVQDRAIRPL